MSSIGKTSTKPSCLCSHIMGESRLNTAD